jgi:hypothetical protein
VPPAREGDGDGVPPVGVGSAAVEEQDPRAIRVAPLEDVEPEAANRDLPIPGHFAREGAAHAAMLAYGAP